MSQSPGNRGGARRPPVRRASSQRLNGVPRPIQGAAGIPGGGLTIVLFGLPVVVLGAVLVLQGRGGEKPKAPVVVEVGEYERAKRLEHEAEPHITRLFQAKRTGNKAQVQSEFKLAQAKLLSAMALLEGLKVRHTDDNTLEGNLLDGFSYLDHDLQKLTEKHIQIIKEVEY